MLSSADKFRQGQDMAELVAVITGSALGIGRGLAQAYGARGATVIGLDVNSSENNMTRALTDATGGHCTM